MTRRLCLLVALGALLVACGTAPTAQAPTSAPDVATSAPAIEPTATRAAVTSAPTAAPTRATAPTAAEPAAPFDETSLQLDGFPPLGSPAPLFEVIAESADTITVRHQQGETPMPRNPQRVVASYGTAEILISLGIIPIGHVTCCPLSPAARTFAPNMELVAVLDNGPNLEQLAALKPDLIIGYGGVGGDEPEVYRLVSAIAPTLLLSNEEATYWQDSTRQIAALFGRAAQAEAVIADYNQRIVPLRARVQAVLDDETVAPVLFFGTPWLYGPTYADDGRTLPSLYTAWLYRELQLTPSPDIKRYFGTGTAAFGQDYLELSAELLPTIEAQHLVVFPAGYGGDETASASYRAYVAQPIWRTIPAVQAGTVYEVTDVGRSEGYYSLLEVMARLADAVEKAPR